MKSKIVFVITFIITLLMLSLFFATIVSGRRNPEDIIHLIISIGWIVAMFLCMFATVFGPDDNK